MLPWQPFDVVRCTFLHIDLIKNSIYKSYYILYEPC